MDWLSHHITNQVHNSIALLSCSPCSGDVQYAFRNAPSEANTQLFRLLDTHFRDFTYICPYYYTQPELDLAYFHSFAWTQTPGFEE